MTATSTQSPSQSTSAYKMDVIVETITGITQMETEVSLLETL